ncbi:hypothetical protein EMIT0194MI4_10589 [Pseudomonas sp. IT-194MI4]
MLQFTQPLPFLFSLALNYLR